METNSGVSCRICKSHSGNDLMKSPCQCKGTLGYVHFACLENWLNQASRNYCELCHYRFQATQTRRYGLIQSIWVWVRNPRNRIYLCYDLLIALVLTALTVAILLICLVGAGVIVQHESAGLQDPYVRIIVILFLLILLASYITTLYLIVQDHIKPWYHWWRNCVNVKLQIDPNAKVVLNKSNPDKTQPADSLPAVETCSIEMLSVMHNQEDL